jgi:hypothetical protein
MRIHFLGGALVLALAASSLGGCWMETEHHGDAPPSLPSDTGPAPTPTDPPKVAIDVGPNLTADPGAGAGLFVSYYGAGKWSLAWTCDTNTSHLPCQFDIDVQGSGLGQVTATTATAPVEQTSTRLVLSQQTSDTLERVTFAATSGSSIVLHATIDGVSQPALVFYVSNGHIVSAPTDPIELVPATP